MNKKIISAIVVVVVLVLVVIAAVVFPGKQQENKLIEEVNKLSALDITKEDIDMDIKTTGKYAVVEKKIKSYLNEYATYIKEAGKLMEDEQFAKVLTAANYQEDGPEFTKTKEYLSSTKQQFNDNMQKLIDMSTEEAIMKYIEEENLDQKYVDLYRNLMFDDEILKEMQETKATLEKTNNMITELIGIEEDVINLLIESKDKWTVSGSQIQFNSRDALNKYNELVGKLSNIDM